MLSFVIPEDPNTPDPNEDPSVPPENPATPPIEEPGRPGVPIEEPPPPARGPESEPA